MYEWKLIVENHVSIDVVLLLIIFVMSTFDFYLCIFVFL